MPKKKPNVGAVTAVSALMAPSVEFRHRRTEAVSIEMVVVYRLGGRTHVRFPDAVDGSVMLIDRIDGRRKLGADGGPLSRQELVLALAAQCATRVTEPHTSFPNMLFREACGELYALIETVMVPGRAHKRGDPASAPARRRAGRTPASRKRRGS